MPDDHSKVVPLLPIPNRTVKRLCADDSADSRVKVGHRQATIESQALPSPSVPGGLLLSGVCRFLMLLLFVRVDATSKTGVYCEAPLIEAASKTEAKCFWGSLKTYSR